MGQGSHRGPCKLGSAQATEARLLCTQTLPSKEAMMQGQEGVIILNQSRATDPLKSPWERVLASTPKGGTELAQGTYRKDGRVVYVSLGAMLCYILSSDTVALVTPRGPQK